MPNRPFPGPGELGDMIVGDLMRLWPDSVRVMLRRRMACPGCLMASFMTVEEAAREHHIDPDDLIDELVAALAVPAAGRGADTATDAGEAGLGLQP